jgi:hypothetical protein
VTILLDILTSNRYTLYIMTNLHAKLSNVVTEYDRKQSGKRGYNPYALSMYLGAVNDACNEIETTGKPASKVLRGYFNDRLLTVVLQTVEE